MMPTNDVLETLALAAGLACQFAADRAAKQTSAAATVSGSK
jgi:hypothetical protein